MRPVRGGGVCHVLSTFFLVFATFRSLYSQGVRLSQFTLFEYQLSIGIKPSSSLFFRTQWLLCVGRVVRQNLSG